MALVEIKNDGTLVSGGWDQSDLQIQAMRGGDFGKEVQEVIGGDDAGCLRENRGGLGVEGGGVALSGKGIILSNKIQPEFEIKDGVADVSIPEELLVDVDPLWKFLVVGII
ncbi:hypothetical protein YC2023_060581 [Brassica napus]